MKKKVFYLIFFSLFFVGCSMFNNLTESKTHSAIQKQSNEQIREKNGTQTISFTISFPQPIVIDTPPFELTGGKPTGGIYSGNGVENNTFSPVKAGVGEHEIVYSLNGKTASDKIKVLPPNVTLSLPRKVVYIAFPPFELSGGNPQGGSYSGKGVMNNKFYPEKAGGGTHSITYTYYGFSANENIVVNGPTPKIINDNCPECHGTNRIKCNKYVTCGTCNGDGRIWVAQCSQCKGQGKIKAWYKFFIGTRNCPICNGSGNIYEKCQDCKGTGKEKCPKCKGTGYAPCSFCK